MGNGGEVIQNPNQIDDSCKRCGHLLHPGMTCEEAYQEQKADEAEYRSYIEELYMGENDG